MDFNSINTIKKIGVNGVTDPNALREINNLDDPKAKAEATADQLETVFWNMMIKSMRETVPDGAVLGRGLGGQQYVDMLDQQLTQMGEFPRDPRFHEALVKQIMNSPEEANRAMTRLGNAEAEAAMPGDAKKDFSKSTGSTTVAPASQSEEVQTPE